MPFYDPMAAKFANRQPDPWQITTTKQFDFDAGFVKWIQKYLEARKVVFDVLAAKQWINGAKFNEKRYEDCSLQWEGYQESIVVKPVLKAVDADSIQPGGVGGDANQSAVDCVDDALASASLSYQEPDLPDKFRRMDGESLEDYRARMAKIVSESIKKVGSW